MLTACILIAALLLAYGNGANDNFKGVATLFGSGTANYRAALLWATVTTLLGSLTAVLLAQSLLKSFSGRGLVDAALVTDPRYVAAVGLGAASTVLLATRIGMPISTTHSIVGALVGVGLTSGSSVNFTRLATDFFAPLLLSPVAAIIATTLLYLLLNRSRRAAGVTHETCLCIEREIIEVVPASPAVAQRVEHLTLTRGTAVTCRSRYAGRIAGIEAGPTLDKLHYLSAGVVSFARGLNDTPKIAALLLLLPALGSFGGVSLVAIAIAVGGLVSARRVAEMMSKRITPMNHGQGFTANLITGCIVIAASRFGWPVSTTHVSCGALFGIGAVTGQARWKTILTIVSAWITTLPAGALLGSAAFWLISRAA